MPPACTRATCDSCAKRLFRSSRCTSLTPWTGTQRSPRSIFFKYSSSSYASGPHWRSCFPHEATSAIITSHRIGALSHGLQCGMAGPDLVSLRDRIEEVDRKIIGLIAERLKIVEDVVEAKLATASP